MRHGRLTTKSAALAAMMSAATSLAACPVTAIPEGDAGIAPRDTFLRLLPTPALPLGGPDAVCSGAPDNLRQLALRHQRLEAAVDNVEAQGRALVAQARADRQEALDGFRDEARRILTTPVEDRTREDLERLAALDRHLTAIDLLTERGERMIAFGEAMRAPLDTLAAALADCVTHPLPEAL